MADHPLCLKCGLLASTHGFGSIHSLAFRAGGYDRSETDVLRDALEAAHRSHLIEIDRLERAIVDQRNAREREIGGWKHWVTELRVQLADLRAASKACGEIGPDQARGCATVVR